MRTPAADALHEIHTATNDVLKGYREMAARAEPEIQAVIQRLTDMHRRHAAAQQAALVLLRDAGKEDASLQGTMNKVVVVMRDWVSDLDRDALPALRRGEQSLRDAYAKALDGAPFNAHPDVIAMLKTQDDEIASQIVRLPAD